jgi:hypothetical protein
MPIAPFARVQAGYIKARNRECCAGAVATLNPQHTTQRAAHAASEFDMRAETQNLVEEIKQSVRLLRRHL